MVNTASSKYKCSFRKLQQCISENKRLETEKKTTK